MSIIIEYGNSLFLLFLLPIVGLVFDYSLSKKVTLYFLICSVCLITPILFEFECIIDHYYQVLGLVALGAIYSYYSRWLRGNKAKIITSAIITGLLFTILAYASFIDSFAGSEKVEEKWEIDDYRIELIASRGFSGKHRFSYQLCEYTMIPLFFKRVDYTINDDSENECTIFFKKKKITFDKCKKEVIKETL